MTTPIIQTELDHLPEYLPHIAQEAARAEIEEVLAEAADGAVPVEATLPHN